MCRYRNQEHFHTFSYQIEVLTSLHGYCESVFPLIKMAYVIYGGLRNPIFCSQRRIGPASVMLSDDLGF